jgi:hypothetical protein
LPLPLLRRQVAGADAWTPPPISSKSSTSTLREPERSASTRRRLLPSAPPSSARRARPTSPRPSWCGPGSRRTTSRSSARPIADPAGAHTPGAALGGSAFGAALGGFAALAGTELLLTGPLLVGIGALAGGFVGAMLSRGVEREATNYYDQAVRKGDILVAVECDPGGDQRERLALAERLLARAGARPLPLLEG